MGDAVAVLDDVLEPGEAVLWSGRPAPGGTAARAGGRMLVMLFYGLILAAFGTVGLGIVAGGLPAVSPGRSAAWIGLTVAALGLVSIGLAWYEGWTARRTLYLLTDRRAVIVRPRALGGSRTHGYGYGWIEVGRAVPHRSEAGDLLFVHRPGTKTLVEPHGFLSIGDVREVEHLLRSKVAAASPGPRAPSLAELLVAKAKVPDEFAGDMPLAVYRLGHGGRAIHAARIVLFGLIVLTSPLTFLRDRLAGGLCLLVGGALLGQSLAQPVAIEVSPAAALVFRRRFGLRPVVIPIRSIRSIRVDPKGFHLTVIHAGGRYGCLAAFRDLPGLLSAIRGLVP